MMKKIGFLEKAKDLKKESNNLTSLVLSIRKYLISHFKILNRSYKAQSILESRFTPSIIAFAIGMSTCGSKTNIAADMLRSLGYEVKKIHGSIPKSKDHAWLKVKDNGIWKQFDITKDDCQVTDQHKVVASCNEWDEINDTLVKNL